MAWKPIVGLPFTSDAFDSYCHGLSWMAWRPTFIVVHNTAVPTLAQRPKGFTKTHMQNLVSFYRDQKGWSAGPHLFIDDKQIWVFSPLTMSGVHSPSWNKLSIGLEMLGNYDSESFDSGRGLEVRKNTVAAMATLSAALGLDPFSARFHFEDPLTNHKCPGTNARKGDLLTEVHDLMLARHNGDHVS